jgi:Protein of unknown function (DUF2568)
VDGTPLMKAGHPITSLSLTLQFLLELAALAALGFWGYSTGGSRFEQIALAVAAPLVAATVWALFGSPKAPLRLAGAWRLLLELGFFGSAAVALAAAGERLPAVALALVVLTNLALLNALGHG